MEPLFLFLLSVFSSLGLTRVFVVFGPSWNGPGWADALLLNILATWCLNHTGRGLTVTALLSFFSHSFFHFFSSSPMQNANIDTYTSLILCFMVLSSVLIVASKTAGWILDKSNIPPSHGRYPYKVLVSFFSTCVNVHYSNHYYISV